MVAQSHYPPPEGQPNPPEKEYPTMDKEHALEILAELATSEMATWKLAQDEYAASPNVFANFNRIARALKTTPEKVLMVYSLKHVDGILSWLGGNPRHREEIDGRINDLRIYMGLLLQMIEARKNGHVTDDPEGEWYYGK